MKQNHNEKEEIHLGDLVRAVKRGGDKLLLAIIKLFAFILRNAVILLILIVAGVVLGYFINEEKKDIYQTSFIVSNYVPSGDYLTKKVEEINFAFQSHDSSFLNEMGLSEEVNHITIDVKPVYVEKSMDDELNRFYRLLQNTDFIDSDHQKKMFSNSFNFQKITLKFPRGVDGTSILSNVIQKISQNEFYVSLAEAHHKDLVNQIQSNEFILNHVDTLLKNFSTNLDKLNNVSNGSNELPVFDLGGVLQQRLEIQERNENLLAAKLASTKFLKIVDKGAAVPTDRNFLSNYKIITFPLILVGLYLFVLLLIALFKKSHQYNRQKHP